MRFHSYYNFPNWLVVTSMYKLRKNINKITFEINN